jgi:hypothetical protein
LRAGKGWLWPSPCAKEALGTTKLPPLDTPLITGDLAFHDHPGGHVISASDWNAFLDFAGR